MHLLRSRQEPERGFKLSTRLDNNLCLNSTVVLVLVRVIVIIIVRSSITRTITSTSTTSLSTRTNWMLRNEDLMPL